MQEVLVVKRFRGKLQYRINQKGQDPDPKWYPALTLSNSPIALQEFYMAYPTKPGLPRNLIYQLDCAQKDQFLELRADDDLKAVLGTE